MPSFSEPQFAYLFNGRGWNILGSSQEAEVAGRGGAAGSGIVCLGIIRVL